MTKVVSELTKAISFASSEHQTKQIAFLISDLTTGNIEWVNSNWPMGIFRSGGYNFPNYDDIRRDVGAKNIIRLDLPGREFDPTTLSDCRQVYETYSPTEVVDDVMNFWTKGRQTMVLLHEIIGHGSGPYNTSKYGPKEAAIEKTSHDGTIMTDENLVLYF